MASGPKKKATSKSAGASRPSKRYEKEAAALGALRCAGVDEAGRGPLAGPLVAAAVVLPPKSRIRNLNDSKVLNGDQRERLFERLNDRGAVVGIGFATNAEIDDLNIFQATRVAMMRAVEDIVPPPDHLLVDGRISLDTTIRQTAIVGGDRLSVSIAAASIIAKVTRDRLMLEIHERYPQYGFNEHKGYATAAHRAALKKHGPCPIHRMHFRGVRELLPLPLFTE